MEFKIDTKDSFTIIMPTEGTISAKMTGELQRKCAEMRQSGSKNFIIDLQNCPEMEENAIAELIAMHEESYNQDGSLVFTAISKQGMALLKTQEADLIINAAPSMQEAIDIVSMEILERDLFNED